MPLRFQCTNCGKIVSIDDSEAGQAVACGSCHQAVVVPKSVTAAGAVIGDFVIDKEIGRGGVATVYGAHQLSLDRPAALKILHQQYVNDPEYLENFLEEARAAAQLNHPHIVQAYAVGEDQGCHYFAMEYIEGTTLKSILAHSGRLVTDKALSIIEQIAEALEFAWQSKELVHRDIKPDNIILTQNGQAKLADLGLAKFGKEFLTDKNSTEVMGTPQYIAPEVLLGKEVDQRTDIYSLGATLYHIVTGHFPYQADSAAELARKHVTEPLTPPNQVISEIPQAVSDIIERMLAKRPPHRYQSGRELIDDIKLYRGQKTIQFPPKAEFQQAIDLDKVDEELAAKIPLKSEKAKQTEQKETTAGSPASRSKTSPNKTGGGTGKAGAKKGRAKLKLSSSKTTGKDTGKQKTEEGAESESPPTETTDKEESSEAKTAAATQAKGKKSGSLKTSKKKSKKTGASGQKSRKKTQKKKSSSKKLAVFLILFAIIGIAALIGIYVASQMRGEPSKYPPAQTEELRRLELMVRRDTDYEKILGRVADIRDKFSDAEEYQAEITTLVAPALEEELRELRGQKHEQEYAQWQRRAKELRREEREKQAQQEWQRIQRRLEREQELGRRERQKQREETVSRLEEQQEQLQEQMQSQESNS
ncbi:MAG: protein kinase domain-containing protein, partial [Verrucomicrobiota bacterium]